jgi:hypothetical protein
MYGVPMIAFRADQGGHLAEPNCPGHQLYAHAQVYWPNDSSSKDVPIGPNGEVLSKFCPTRYLVKDPDTSF